MTSKATQTERHIEAILENGWYKTASAKEMAHALLSLKDGVIEETTRAIITISTEYRRAETAKLNQKRTELA